MPRILTTAANVTSARDLFADPAASYVYRIHAVNSGGSSSPPALSAAITVPAMGPLSPIMDAWRIANFGTATATGAAADTADPDGDGLKNLLEYALGTNPQSQDQPATTLQPSLTSDLGGGYLAITFHRRRNADVRYTVEVSPDLATWSSATVQVGVPLPTADPSFEQVTVRDVTPHTANARCFIRVRISRF